MKRSINIHCRKDRKGLRMSYTPTGDGKSLVLQGITICCPYCKEARSLHNMTEALFLEKVVGDKFFI